MFLEKFTLLLDDPQTFSLDEAYFLPLLETKTETKGLVLSSTSCENQYHRVGFFSTSLSQTFQPADIYRDDWEDWVSMDGSDSANSSEDGKDRDDSSK